MTDSTGYEQSKLGHSELKDVIITTAAVSIVVGICLGLLAATKPVIKGVAIAIGAGSAAGAATYFWMDYRHVDRRNALRSTIHELTAQNTQLQRDRDQSTQATLQLQTELDRAKAQFNQLADVAEREQAKLQAQLDAAIASAQASATPAVVDQEAAATLPLPQDAVQVAV